MCIRVKDLRAILDVKNSKDLFFTTEPLDADCWEIIEIAVIVLEPFRDVQLLLEGDT